MINIEKLKTFISHPDLRVRRQVMRYFHTTRIQDPDLLSLALESGQKYGFEDNTFLLYDCRHLYFDTLLADYLWSLLMTSKSAIVKIHTVSLLCNAPVDYLSEHLRELKQKGFGGHIQKAIARIRYRDAGARQLWTELCDYSRKKSRGQVNPNYVEALLELLRPMDTPTDEQILHLLEDEEVKGQWLEVFLVQLAAARRLETAIPVIDEKMNVDDDFLAPASMEALGQIGTQEVIKTVVQGYETKLWNYQLYAAGVFERVRLEESEKAVIGLLEKKDLIPHDIYCQLCFSLCDMFSESAFHWGRTVVDDIEAMSYDNMKERLIILAAVLGKDLPERDLWESQMDSDLERLRAYRQGQVSPVFELQDSLSSVESPYEEEDFMERPIPIQAPRGKVGRNDPCPCGSGRKYKKCCGRL